MDWKAVGGKIANIAPILGTVLGGPLGGAAGGLIKILAGEFGLKGEPTADEFAKALSLDPEAALKLRQFEMTHKVELQKLAIEADRIYLQDRQDARKRQVESEKATGKRDTNLYVIAYWFLGGFFITIIVMVYLMLSGALPETVPEFVVFLLGSLFGTLTGGVGAIMQYFYGSSKGSADKNVALMEMRHFTETVKK